MAWVSSLIVLALLCAAAPCRALDIPVCPGSPYTVVVADWDYSAGTFPTGWELFANGPFLCQGQIIVPQSNLPAGLTQLFALNPSNALISLYNGDATALDFDMKEHGGLRYEMADVGKATNGDEGTIRFSNIRFTATTPRTDWLESDLPMLPCIHVYNSDAEASEKVMGNITLVLEEVQISDFLVSMSAPYSDSEHKIGSAITFNPGGSLIMDSCSIVGITVTSVNKLAGAIYFTGSYLNATDTVFSTNTIRSTSENEVGGAITFGPIFEGRDVPATSQRMITLRGTNFVLHKSSFAGGAIFADTTSFNSVSTNFIDNQVFSVNPIYPSVRLMGGAVALKNAMDCPACTGHTLHDTTFQDNNIDVDGLGTTSLRTFGGALTFYGNASYSNLGANTIRFTGDTRMEENFITVIDPPANYVAYGGAVAVGQGCTPADHPNTCKTIVADSWNCVTNSIDFKGSGGCIAVLGAKSAQFTGCSFRHNVANTDGGALLLSNVGESDFVGCSFINNNAPKGGAIAQECPLIGGCTPANLTVRGGSVFDDNHASSSGSCIDGALTTDGASFNMSDTVVTDHQPPQLVTLFKFEYETVSMENILVEDLTATSAYSLLIVGARLPRLVMRNVTTRNVVSKSGMIRLNSFSPGAPMPVLIENCHFLDSTLDLLSSNIITTFQKARIDIIDTVVSGITGSGGSFVFCQGCDAITVTGSHFRNVNSPSSLALFDLPEQIYGSFEMIDCVVENIAGPRVVRADGIPLNFGTRVYLSESTFRNILNAHDGGIVTTVHRKFLLENCNFEDISSTGGGVVWTLSGLDDVDTSAVAGCNFTNVGSGNNGGGVIRFATNGILIVVDSHFSDVSSNFRGGVIYRTADAEGHLLVLLRCSVHTFTAGAEGGIIYDLAGLNIKIWATVVTAGSAHGGGAIWANPSTFASGPGLQILHSNFTGIQNNGQEGGVVNWGGGGPVDIVGSHFEDIQQFTKGTIHIRNKVDVLFDHTIRETNFKTISADTGSCVYSEGTGIVMEDVNATDVHCEVGAGAFLFHAADIWASPLGGAVVKLTDITLTQFTSGINNVPGLGVRAELAHLEMERVHMSNFVGNPRRTALGIALDNDGLFNDLPAYKSYLRSSSFEDFQSEGIGGSGGAIHVELERSDMEFRLTDVRFSAIHVPTIYGGIMATKGGAIHLDRIEIEGPMNVSNGGGAVWSTDSVFSMKNCHWSGGNVTNFIDDQYAGGGLLNLNYFEDGSVSIENCSFTNSYSPTEGGCIKISTGLGSRVNLTGVSFEGCTSGYAGGALRLSAFETTITNASIVNCHADTDHSVTTASAVDYGGGAISQGAYTTGNLTLHNVNISGNSATHRGGCVSSQTSLRISESEFSDCVVTNGNGGAIALGQGITGSLSRSTIKDSHAVTTYSPTHSNGGGIAVGENSSLSLTEVWINECSATLGSGFGVGGGGGVFTKGSGLNITQSTISNCSVYDAINPSAGAVGGGIYDRGIASNSRFVSSTFENNAAGLPTFDVGDLGGFFYADNPASLVQSVYSIDYCTIINNRAEFANTLGTNASETFDKEFVHLNLIGVLALPHPDSVPINDGQGETSEFITVEAAGCVSSTHEITMFGKRYIEDDSLYQSTFEFPRTPLGDLQIWPGTDMVSPAREATDYPAIIMAVFPDNREFMAGLTEDQTMRPFADCTNEQTCEWLGDGIRAGSVQSLRYHTPTPSPTATPTSSPSPSHTPSSTPFPSPSPSPTSTLLQIYPPTHSGTVTPTPSLMSNPSSTPNSSPSPSPSPSPYPLTSPPAISPSPPSPPAPTQTFVYSGVVVEPSSGNEDTTFDVTIFRDETRRSRSVEMQDRFNIMYTYTDISLTTEGVPPSDVWSPWFDTPQSSDVLSVAGFPVGNLYVWGLSLSGGTGEYVVLEDPFEISVEITPTAKCNETLTRVQDLLDRGLVQEASSLLAAASSLPSFQKDLQCLLGTLALAEELQDDEGSPATVIQVNVNIGQAVADNDKLTTDKERDEIIATTLANVNDALQEVIASGGDVVIGDDTIEEVVHFIDIVGQLYDDNDEVDADVATGYLDTINSVKQAALLNTDCGDTQTFSSGSTTFSISRTDDHTYTFEGDDSQFAFEKDTINSLKGDDGCVAVSLAQVVNFPPPCTDMCSECRNRVSEVNSFTFHNATGLFEPIDFKKETADDAKVLITIVLEDGDLSKVTETTQTSCGSTVTKMVKPELRCNFYDSETSCWSGKGCKTLRVRGNEIDCECDHLTDYAVLLSGGGGGGGGGNGDCDSGDGSWEWDLITILSLVCMGVAIIVIILIILLFTYMKRMRKLILGTEGHRVDKLMLHKAAAKGSAESSNASRMPQTKRARMGVPEGVTSFQVNDEML